MSGDNDSDTEKGIVETVKIDAGTLKAIKIFAAIALVMFCVIAILVPLMASYNSLVDSDLQVNRAAANVKTDLERRADLLPNLASTVQGSATFEYKTLTDVTLARAGASKQIKSDIQNTPATDLNALNSKQEQLTNILGNFVKLQEQYPTLQTTQQFREFSAQVTATENQILMDRQTYNAAVMQYQSICRSFPTNLIAGYYGFAPDRYQMYQPIDQARAEAVPNVTFDFTNL